jgi:hypothetical protein
MKTCTKCEAELEDTAKFCSNCGKKLVNNIDFDALRAELAKEFHADHVNYAIVKVITGKYCTSNEIRIHEYSGGNCWNDDESEYHEFSETYNTDRLLNILVKYSVTEPTAFYLLSKFEERIENTIYEYYGNSTTYEICVYDIDKIINTVNDL